ncbi:MAG: RCC1 domain-containing protein, partial [bacterium]
VCLLTIKGGVKCWGNNSSGQLGDGTNIGSSTPVDVSGLTSGVQAISAGDNHTCALTVAGGAKCWGDNRDGQLGDGIIGGSDCPGSNTCSAIPVDVFGLGSGVTAITADGSHTCALTSTGAVQCWGKNDAGQLGNSSASDPDCWCSAVPVPVSGLASGVAYISAGGSHTCEVTSGGGVKCWGAGYGDAPAGVIGLTADVSAVSAGSGHNCALMNAGGVKCWGSNSSGELGNGTTQASASPVDVIALTGPVAAVSAGDGYTCAATVAGGIKCWGVGSSSETPVDVVELVAKPTPTPTACPGGKVPVVAGCGTPTRTPTPCPTGKVAALGACVSPTPTQTPCPVGKVTGVVGCGTPTPTATPCGAIANDEFANSASVSIPYSGSLSTLCATTQAGEPRPCAGIGATVWYRYTPATSQRLQADTVGSDHDTGLAIYTGSSLNSLTLVGCDDDSGGQLTSLLSFTGSAATTYYFQVGGCCGQRGELAFNLHELPTPTATATPCPLGKVPSVKGCGTPTATPTPQPPWNFLPGLDVSLAIGTQCDSTAGPTKCTVGTGQTFTVDFKVDHIPAGFAYAGYDAAIQYFGLDPVASSVLLQGPGLWPSCVFGASSLAEPGVAKYACANGVNSPWSTYTGAMGRMNFRCPLTPITGTLTLLTGPGKT